MSSAPPGHTQAPDLVIGIGASAGGIGALRQFFAHVPANTRAAFVVVLHLSPDHESHLAEVLQAAMPLPVVRVQTRCRLDADHVYVITPNGSLTIEDGEVVVTPLTVPEQRYAPVDILFRTLALTHGPRAVGVVLSGTGLNGSNGVKWIKAHGGLVIVQDPEESEFPDMPRNSLATGLVDYALPAAAIPDAVVHYYARRATPRLASIAETPPLDTDGLRDILSLLRSRTGHDFSSYKPGTILRRIARRMHLHDVESLHEYARFARNAPDEAGLLLNELLISVTSFFRDSTAFEVLARRVVAPLIAGCEPNRQLRIWVAGCATGEEAYTVAMLVAEAAGRLSTNTAQIVASDLDARAINIAREGMYTDADVADVSEERLRRFFVREHGRYRVRRELRETILFAHHNLIRDPPFSRLDLVVCRNVLIYLTKPVQRRLFETFHFALRPGGYLFLGGSEAIDGAGELFAPLDKSAHLFESRPAATRLPTLFVNAGGHRDLETRLPDRRPAARPSPADLHRRLLEAYAPPSIVITEDHQLVHVSDSAAAYLEMPGGEPSRDLFKLLKPELRIQLRAAMHQALRDRNDVELDAVPFTTDGSQRVNVRVRPVLAAGEPARGYLLLLFETVNGAAGVPAPIRTAPAGDAAFAQLEDELEQLRAQLGGIIEQHESQVEEAKASNEELQAMNEELRSAAEELETGKEELQSVNEELTTVNQELKSKIEELALTNNDFQNFINSTDIGTIFLDRGLRVKLYTPRACEVFHLRDSDIGRPLAHIAHTLRHARLSQDIARVLERLQTVEHEVESDAARWYLMRVLPYRTADNEVEGVVLTFLEITQRRGAEARSRSSEEKLRLLIENAVDYAIYTTTPDGVIDSWNVGAARLFGYAADEAMGRGEAMLFTPGDRAAGVPEAQREQARRAGRSVDNREQVRRSGTRFFCAAVTTPLGADAALGFARIARDLTAQREADAAVSGAHQEVEASVSQRTESLQAEIARRSLAQEHVTDLMHRLVATQEAQHGRLARLLQDEFGTPLATLCRTLERLRHRTQPAGGDGNRDIDRALELARHVDRELEFLVWGLRPSLLDELGLAVALPRFVRDWSVHYGLSVDSRIEALARDIVPRDVAVVFFRIAQEALDNVRKHAHATRITISLAGQRGAVELMVEDDGVGFDATTPERGQGLGLPGMHNRAMLIGGVLDVESSPGNGTRLRLRYPAGSAPQASPPPHSPAL